MCFEMTLAQNTKKKILQPCLNMRNVLLELHEYLQQHTLIVSERIEIYSYFIRQVKRTQAAVQLFLSTR